jgi:dTDP-4-dehydrorhamnose reductase
MEAWWNSLKLLITGAGGLYGSKLAQLAIAKNFEVYSSDVHSFSVYGSFVKLDISDKEQVEEVFEAIKPDVVVHAATLTDVDKCETDKELAWKVNVEGTKNIVEASESSGSFLIYISTDYVFNGESGRYKETDKPDPINYYGLTKLKAEEIIQAQIEHFIASQRHYGSLLRLEKLILPSG